MNDPASEKIYDLAIVGAGASGLLAAISAAARDRRVVLFERMESPGLKLAASGGGRGNLTNMLPRAEFEKAFGRQGRFIGPALELFGPERLRELLTALGVKTKEEPSGRVYPASNRATEVVNVLRQHAIKLGAEFVLDTGVSRVLADHGRLTGVMTPDGPVRAERVLLACGGQSYSQLGGSESGYSIARKAGHSIVEPVPALVPLITRERWLTELAGVSLPGVRIRIDLPKQSKAGVAGDILFTHQGISGPVILNLSGDISRLLTRHERVPLKLELLDGRAPADWSEKIERWRSTDGKRTVPHLLKELIPASLAQELCKIAGVDKLMPVGDLPAESRDYLCRLLGALKLTITATEGFGNAHVTRGGVKLKEVDPRTLQSRILPGLYLSGEILDLDGPTGGYNLQWAFSSGWLAGVADSR